MTCSQKKPEQDQLSDDLATHSQAAKNQAAIDILNEWLCDESGYDEQVWPILQEAIETNRSSSRKRFAENDQ
jgi:hypothetical protein